MLLLSVSITVTAPTKHSGTLDQFMSLTEGTALLFESEWVLYPTFGSPPAPTTHPTLQPSIGSTRDITGTKKTLKKQQHSNS